MKQLHTASVIKMLDDVGMTVQKQVQYAGMAGDDGHATTEGYIYTRHYC